MVPLLQYDVRQDLFSHPVDINIIILKTASLRHLEFLKVIIQNSWLIIASNDKSLYFTLLFKHLSLSDMSRFQVALIEHLKRLSSRSDGSLIVAG